MSGVSSLLFLDVFWTFEQISLGIFDRILLLTLFRLCFGFISPVSLELDLDWALRLVRVSFIFLLVSAEFHGRVD